MKEFSFYTIVYGFLLILSIGLTFLFERLFKGKINVRARYAFISISLILFGYLVQSASSSLTLSLNANRLSYLGSVFLLNQLLFIIFDLCNVHCNRMLKTGIQVLSVLAILLVFTGGTSIDWYYHSVSLERIDSGYLLVKEYGSYHFLYLLYVMMMYALMFGTLHYAYLKKKMKSSVNPAILLFLISENIVVWVLERYVSIHLELLSLSYVIAEVMFIILFKNVNEYEQLYSLVEKAMQRENKTIELIIEKWKEEYELTDREIEIVRLLIRNITRSEIAEELKVSENTIKKHVAHIYDKLSISSRSDLLYKMNDEILK